jgi:class 3 adenylate cyclase/CheY-like chemotaxis protein
LKWKAMMSRYAEIRYSMRSLVDQIIGYCDVLVQQPEATEALRAGVGDICGVAKSIGASLDLSRLNSRQLENLGGRAQTLSSQIGHRSDELRHLARHHGESDVTVDFDRLRAVADKLMPLAKELILNHDLLAADQESTSLAGNSALRAATGHRESDQTAAALLVVDDNEGNRDLLVRRLARAGYSSISVAPNGREALELLKLYEVDLVLLDVMMPEIDGFNVLRTMKQDETLRDIPVVMISAVDDVSSVAQCIELGAEDYLPKPFDQVLLQARIRGSLERKHLRDAEKRRTKELEQALREIDKAHQASEDLLRNILPRAIAEELQEYHAVAPMYFEDVTIVFTDFVGFTAKTERLAAEELVGLLHEYFTAMDLITERYGLEKMKTIGDSYMFAGGLPLRNPAHPVDAVLAALEILDFVEEMKASRKGNDWSVRIGIHTGPVIAGVVGVRKFAFDIWGETVNIASRMESGGTPDRINLSDRTFTRIKDFFTCEHRGKIATKEGHQLEMYTIISVEPKLLGETGRPPPAFARRYGAYFRKELSEFPRIVERQPEG